MQWNRGQLQEIRRVFRRLCEPGSFLKALFSHRAEKQYGVFVKRNRWAKPVLKMEATTVNLFLKADLLTQQDAGQYSATPAGRALYRRLCAQAKGETPADSFAAQHQLRHVDSAGVRHNAQTPLDWLKARNNGTAVTQLTGDELAAAERLQIDYEHSGLRARLTIDWTRPIVQGTATRSDMSTAGQLDARQRFNAAMQYVGPGLHEVLFAVCCELTGLEEVESRFGWPRRSAKLVLKIALTRLAHFYQTRPQRAPKRQCAVP